MQIAKLNLKRPGLLLEQLKFKFRESRAELWNMKSCQMLDVNTNARAHKPQFINLIFIFQFHELSNVILINQCFRSLRQGM